MTPIAGPFEGIFGLIMVQFFLDGLFSFRSIFRDQAGVLRSRPWGLEIALVSGILELWFQLLARLIVLVGCFAAFGVSARWSWPLALPGCLGLSLLGISSGLLLAPFSCLRRDLDHLMQVVPWLLLVATPVFLPWTASSPLAHIYRYNPLSWLVQAERVLAYGTNGLSWPGLLLLPMGIGLLACGWLWAKTWQPHLLERTL